MARAVLGGLATFQFIRFLAIFVIFSSSNVCHSHEKGADRLDNPSFFQKPLVLQFNLDSTECGYASSRQFLIFCRIASALSFRLHLSTMFPAASLNSILQLLFLWNTMETPFCNCKMRPRYYRRRSLSVSGQRFFRLYSMRTGPAPLMGATCTVL